MGIFLNLCMNVSGRGLRERYLLKVGLNSNLNKLNSIYSCCWWEIGDKGMKSFSINWHQLVPFFLYPPHFLYYPHPKSHLHTDTHMELTNNNKSVSINLNWNWSATQKKTSLSHSRKFYGNLWTIFIQPDFCVILVWIQGTFQLNFRGQNTTSFSWSWDLLIWEAIS